MNKNNIEFQTFGFYNIPNKNTISFACKFLIKYFFIIGNNSINSIAQAEKMLNAGANGISIARAAIKGELNFDLNKIKI